jgi:MFS family permease
MAPGEDDDRADEGTAFMAGAAATRPALFREPSVRGLAVLAASFCCLFGGWVPMETLLSTYEGALGYLSMTLVYLAVIPGSFFTPWVLARTGDARVAMALAAAPYTAFAAALLAMELGYFTRGELLLPCAVGVGLGCGVLWGSQGVLIKQFSLLHDHARPGGGGSLGLFTGVGQGSSNLGGLLALFISSVLSQLRLERRALYLVLFLLLAAGNTLLFLLPDAAGLLRTNLGHQPGPGGGGGSSVGAIPRLLRASPALRWLQFAMLSHGYANAFMSGSFTADVIAPTLGEGWIGHVMAVRGLAAVLSGVAFGHLSDRVGRFRTYMLSLSCEGVLALFCTLGSFSGSAGPGGGGPPFALVFVLVVFMGVGNTGSQTMMKAIIGDLFDDVQTVRWTPLHAAPQAHASVSVLRMVSLRVLATGATARASGCRPTCFGPPSRAPRASSWARPSASAPRRLVCWSFGSERGSARWLLAAPFVQVMILGNCFIDILMLVVDFVSCPRALLHHFCE